MTHKVVMSYYADKWGWQLHALWQSALLTGIFLRVQYFNRNVNFRTPEAVTEPSVGNLNWSPVHTRGAQTSVKDAQTYVPSFPSSLSPKSTCTGSRRHSCSVLSFSLKCQVILSFGWPFGSEKGLLVYEPYLSLHGCLLVSLTCAQGSQKAQEKLWTIPDVKALQCAPHLCHLATEVVDNWQNELPQKSSFASPF